MLLVCVCKGDNAGVAVPHCLFNCNCPSSATSTVSVSYIVYVIRLCLAYIAYMYRVQIFNYNSPVISWSIFYKFYIVGNKNEYMQLTVIYLLNGMMTS